MSIEVSSEYGNNMRVRDRWLSIPQGVMYLGGILFSIWMVDQTGQPWYLALALITFVLAAPLGRYGRPLLFAPLGWFKTAEITMKDDTLSRMSEDSAPIAGDGVPKGGFHGAYHGKITHQTEEGTDILPLLLDGSKRRGSLPVTASGLSVGAGGDEDTRLAHMQTIAAGIRDAVNASIAPVTVTSLLCKRPGDVHVAMGHLERQMADAVRDAPDGSGYARGREYALGRAWEGDFTDTIRAWMVSADLGYLSSAVGVTLFSDPPRRRLPDSSDVYESPLWLAAEGLHASLVDAQAEDPTIADAADQAKLVSLLLTTHPEDLEAIYRRSLADHNALLAAGEIAIDTSQLARRGPFPFSTEVGHDWVLTGRTYHRIIHILGGRDEVLPVGFNDRFIANAGYPVIFSSVHTSIPGRSVQRIAEEKARFEEIRLQQKAADFDSVPERYKAGLDQAVRDRDLTFLSGAAPMAISNGVIVSAPSLSALKVVESMAKHQLSTMRVDSETVTGKAEQLPWLLYFLGLAPL